MPAKLDLTSFSLAKIPVLVQKNLEVLEKGHIMFIVHDITTGEMAARTAMQLGWEVRYFREDKSLMLEMTK
ncbi:MAG: hypothetical protein FH756_15025 [Firmicutes bacterium]|nr:hypothetical protein [Bacillota bacterium]